VSPQVGERRNTDVPGGPQAQQEAQRRGRNGGYAPPRSPEGELG
jgi:hypothetical protein